MALQISSRAARRVASTLGSSVGNRQLFVCSSCRASLQYDQPTLQSRLVRNFTYTSSVQKKSSGSPKSNRKSPEISTSDNGKLVPDNKNSKNADKEIDPYDYSELQSSINTAIARMRDALTKTKDAGRVTAEQIEGLPVELSVDGAKEKFKVGDLASVVPKGGRMMQVFCSEEAHVKPLTSSIQASSFSLTPQPDSTNPLLLLIPVPPATAETRSQAAAEAKKVFDKVSLDIRNARGDAQKKFRKMEIQKLVIKDELHKAHKGMEDVVKKGQDEAKKVYDAGLKVLQN